MLGYKELLLSETIFLFLKLTVKKFVWYIQKNKLLCKIILIIRNSRVWDFLHLFLSR